MKPVFVPEVEVGAILEFIKTTLLIQEWNLQAVNLEMTLILIMILLITVTTQSIITVLETYIPSQEALTPKKKLEKTYLRIQVYLGRNLLLITLRFSHHFINIINNTENTNFHSTRRCLNKGNFKTC